MGKSRGKPNKRKLPYGLHPRSFSRVVRDQVDQDYVDKLSDEDKEWLAKFNQAFYDGNFKGEGKEDWTTDQRRAAYRANNARKRDVYGRARGLGALAYSDTLDRESQSDEPDLEPSPAYLDTVEWREAVAEWRRHVDAKTTGTAEGRAARWRCEELQARVEKRGKSSETKARS